MKTILVINDHTAEAEHATKFILSITEKLQAKIVLANTCKITAQVGRAVLAATVPENAGAGDVLVTEIDALDISAMDENELAALINREQFWMIVKGMPDHPAAAAPSLNVHTVLNKIRCPILFIPSSWPLKALERIVYLADLRYCRIEIVRYLAGLAKPWTADLLIAHLSAKGLPDIEKKYAMRLFSETVGSNVDYERLFFNNINEKKLLTAVDVIINGMHNDLLVMVNHRFHFEEIIGRHITAALPSNITVPLLIFPY